MNSFTPQNLFIDGPAGRLEAVLVEPDLVLPRGIAVIAHPHPQYGGTMNHKVVHTLFKTLWELGFIAVKFNYRGVEKSEGRRHATGDSGEDETADVLAVVEATRKRFASSFHGPAPLVLAGFSFGGAIQAWIAPRLQPQILIMVAPPVERMRIPCLTTGSARRDIEPIPEILIIQGDHDDIVPLRTVLDWSAPQELPVVVIPGAEHFFHGRLHILKRIIQKACGPVIPSLPRP
ncbi:MAG: esterase/lipase/thioesterase family active site protein [Nitrosospira sp.]